MSSAQGNARETSDVELDSRGQHTMDQIKSVYTPVCTHQIFQLPSDEFPKIVPNSLQGKNNRFHGHFLVMSSSKGKTSSEG